MNPKESENKNIFKEREELLRELSYHFVDDLSDFRDLLYESDYNRKLVAEKLKRYSKIFKGLSQLRGISESENLRRIIEEISKESEKLANKILSPELTPEEIVDEIINTKENLRKMVDRELTLHYIKKYRETI